mmetsp:Transcript_7258/g.13812  ORF Transcript_7258/g.13812 Transcript_7258/m.13812 type:complete len:253 (+) Transcript_7258:910-1668(+)
MHGARNAWAPCYSIPLCPEPIFSTGMSRLRCLCGNSKLIARYVWWTYMSQQTCLKICMNRSSRTELSNRELPFGQPGIVQSLNSRTSTVRGSKLNKSRPLGAPPRQASFRQDLHVHHGAGFTHVVPEFLRARAIAQIRNKHLGRWISGCGSSFTASASASASAAFAAFATFAATFAAFALVGSILADMDRSAKELPVIKRLNGSAGHLFGLELHQAIALHHIRTHHCAAGLKMGLQVLPCCVKAQIADVDTG